VWVDGLFLVEERSCFGKGFCLQGMSCIAATFSEIGVLFPLSNVKVIIVSDCILQGCVG